MAREITEELFNQINFKELEAHISGELGLPIILTCSLEEYRGRKCVSIKSQNLAGASGVFSRVFKEVRIREFPAKYQDNGTFWVSVSLRWEYFKGGSNGATLLDAVWSFNDKMWIITQNWR
jgi:hypothetical protein